MRIAALSDIHSNVFALEAVIEDVMARKADVIVNLGDILYGPIAPRATYDLLKQHNFITIRGNQDLQIYEATSDEINANPTMQFILNDLGGEPLEWMQRLPFDHQFDEDVYLCHGTPNDDLIYLLENVSTGKAVLRSDNEILEMLQGQNSSLILCGHSHLPRTVSLSSGQIVVNPGSVGLPAYTDDEPVKHSMENHSHHASYTIIEKSSQGWLTQHIKVPYAFQKAIEAAEKRNRMDWVHFLSTGRGLYHALATERKKPRPLKSDVML